MNQIVDALSYSHSQVACEYFSQLVMKLECSYMLQSRDGGRMAIRLFVKTVEPETALEPAKVTNEDVAELLVDQVRWDNV